MTKTLNNRPLAQVLEFQEKFKQPILKEGEKPTQERINLRIRLLREELAELKEAIEERDIYHTAKELADLYYVYWGAVIEFGYARLAEESDLCYHYLYSSEYDIEIFKVTLSQIHIHINFLESAFKHGFNDDFHLDQLRDSIDLICCELGLEKHIHTIFNEVHRSNMSKLDDNGNPIFREDGKILKSANYSPANIQSVVEL